MAHRLAPLAALAAALSSAPARADTCTSDGVDALNAARQSRRIIEDFHRVEGRLAQERTGVADLLRHVDSNLTWSFSGFGIADVQTFEGYRLCTAAGREDATLLRQSMGGGLFFEDRTSGTSGALFAVVAMDTLSWGERTLPPDPETPDAPLQSPRVDYPQQLFAGRVNWSGDLVATAGFIARAAPTSNVEPALAPVALDGPDDGTGFFGFSLPAWHVGSEVILDSDFEPNTMRAGLDRWPVGPEHAPVLLSGGVGYLRDEEVATLDAEAAELLGLFTVGLSLEPLNLRLRNARARFDLNGGAPHDALGPGADPTARGLLAWRPLYGLFAEGTVVDGERFTEVADRRFVPGFGVGGRLGFTNTMISVNMEVYGGRNRGHVLADLSEALDRPEFGMAFLARFGL